MFLFESCYQITNVLQNCEYFLKYIRQSDHVLFRCVCHYFHFYRITAVALLRFLFWLHPTLDQIYPVLPYVNLSYNWFPVLQYSMYPGHSDSYMAEILAWLLLFLAPGYCLKQCRFISKGTTQSSASWWSYQLEAFSALQALCVGNSLVNGEFLSQRASNADVDVSLMWVRISSQIKSLMTGDLRIHNVHITSL